MPENRLTLAVSLKLYMDVPQSARWAREVAALAMRHPATRDGSVRLVALPSLPALSAVSDELSGTEVLLGAQDLFWEDRGAYTGSVSGSDLRQIGCSFVEVGHAERRALFAETDEIVAKKVAAAVRNTLTPILCVGEVHRTDIASETCVSQLESALARVDGPIDDFIVAYEPVWAIGADSPAPATYVSTVCRALRESLGRDGRFGQASVIYGGSAQPGTLSALGESVDGLFLGRFAHDVHQLAQMIDEAASLN